MPVGGAEQAHAVVAAMRTGAGAGPWRLERAAVADRLHRLVDDPGKIRQGTLNLCGPALLFKVWLERDPVAAVTYVATLFNEGRSRIGALDVRASRALLSMPYGSMAQQVNCPPADWMMMAALRDASNRVIRYAHLRGVREGMAAMTLPGGLIRWLVATGQYVSVRDQTNLVLRKGIRHARGLSPTTDRELFVLVASEMFRRPPSTLRKIRDAVVSQIPNHWIQLTSPVEADSHTVAFRFWSWGADNAVVVSRPTFDRCYYGCLVAESTLHSPAAVE